MSCRSAWGEARVQYLDPLTEQVRSLPIAWTSLAPIDSFVRLAKGQTLLRLVDLQRLSDRLHDLTADEPVEGGALDNRPDDSQ